MGVSTVSHMGLVYVHYSVHEDLCVHAMLVWYAMCMLCMYVCVPRVWSCLLCMVCIYILCVCHAWCALLAWHVVHVHVLPIVLASICECASPVCVFIIGWVT